MRKISGFTLIELMIAASIVAILAMIAIPKFADMVIKAKEAAIKGQLGSLRSALLIYCSDNEGWIPYTVGVIAPVYIESIPRPGEIPGYRNHNTWGRYYTHNPTDYDAGLGLVSPSQRAPWNYVTDARLASIPMGTPAQSGTYGDFYVACTHTDHGGRIWSTW